MATNISWPFVDIYRKRLKMIHLIGDTHFFHRNIIKYCGRPFSSVDEMNDALIKNWNAIVSASDTIIHVGDFSFCQDKIAAQILSSLKGLKILVRGNHDKSPERMEQIGFNLVVESMMMHVPNVGKCFFSHYPIESDSALKSILDETDCKYQVHGHSHNGRPYFDGLRFNVSCEMIGYKPIQLFVPKDTIRKDTYD